MESAVTRFTASDGASICLHRWLPDAAVRPSAVIQIAHGMGEHAERYGRVAQALCAAGFAVYANDHRGHGHTVASPSELGDMGPDGWNRCVQDLRELNHWLAERHAGLPRVLLGHSMGAALTQQYLILHGRTLSAAVLSGSSTWGNRFQFAIARLVARFERWRLGDTGSSPLLGAMLFGSFNRRIESPRTPFDWLSRDPAEVDKYVADPLCGFGLRVRSQVDMFDAALEARRPERLEEIPKDLPLYLFSGDADPVHDRLRGFWRLLADYRRAGLTHISQRLYPGGRHEMFNETNRDEVIADLLDWLRRTLRGCRPGLV